MGTRPQDQEAASRWCAGLPLAELRRLTAAEAAALRGDLRRQLARCGAALASLVACAAALVWALARPGPDEGAWLAAFGLLVPMLMLLVYVGESSVRGWLLWRDSRAGTLQRFEGVLGKAESFDLTRRRLLDAHALVEAAEGAQSLLVLPVSRRVWRANGRPVRRWLTVRWSDVAETPAIAAIAAQWVQPVATSEAGTLSANRRDLSPDEVSELRRHARAVWRRLLPGLLPWAWAVSVLVRAAREHDLPADPAVRAFAGAFLGFLAVVALSGLGGLAYAAVRVRRLGMDVRRGVALVFRLERAPGSTDALPDEDLADLAAVKEYEVLPASRALWTEAGRPAAWRKVAQ